MRYFGYITVGRILAKLREDGMRISRVTFYKMEEEGVFLSKRASKGWRVYTPEEARAVIKSIKDDRNYIKPSESVIL